MFVSYRGKKDSNWEQGASRKREKATNRLYARMRILILKLLPHMTRDIYKFNPRIIFEGEMKTKRWWNRIHYTNVWYMFAPSLFPFHSFILVVEHLKTFTIVCESVRALQAVSKMSYYYYYFSFFLLTNCYRLFPAREESYLSSVGGPKYTGPTLTHKFIKLF